MAGSDVYCVDNDDVALAVDEVNNQENEHVRPPMDETEQRGAEPSPAADRIVHSNNVSKKMYSVGEVELATTLTKFDEKEDNATPLPSLKGRQLKRLSTSVEKVDLEYSLGSLDSSQCNNESSVSASTPSAKRKKMTPMKPYMPEDEYSMPFPPAPPSTPAAPRDAFAPLPLQACLTRGKLSFGNELRRVEQKGIDQEHFIAHATTRHHEDILPLPLSSRREGIMQQSHVSTPSRSRLSQKYHAEGPPPDLSGAVTEPRRGNSYHAGKPRPSRSTESDFDKWDVGDRYQLKRILGRGSYGEVAQAIDLQAVASHEKTEGEQDNPRQSRSAYVAVKKISNAFDQEVDAIRLFREMHILRRLRGHACVIQLFDVIQPRSSDLEHFHDLYLVFEYVDTDLYKLIMSPQYLTTEHIQTFLYQMLVGLKYIHCSSGEFD